MGWIFGRRKRSRRSRTTSVSANIPLIRWLGPVVTVAAALGLVGMAVAGKIDLSALDDYAFGDSTGDAEAAAPDGTASLARRPSLAEKSAETIRIATFNVQTYRAAGEATDSEAATIGEIVSQFDVVALQGLAGGDTSSLKRVVDWLRSAGGKYTATISDPVGPPGQTMSYAFLWDESRIQLAPAGASLVQDPADRMRFEPMFASFEARVGYTDGRNPFRFTLLTAFCPPKSPNNITGNVTGNVTGNLAGNLAGNEVDVLADVFVSVRNFVWETTGEEDYVLLANLADTSNGLGRVGQLPGIVSVTSPVQSPVPVAAGSDNHILMDPRFTAEFTGKTGELDLPRSTGDAANGATRRQLPTWAEFSVFEVPRFEQAIGSRTQLVR